MKEFDRETLARHDGKGGRETVYLAHSGKVYDVSTSKLWKNGEHMRRHHAGADLTSEFSEAPHGTEVFERFQQVGTLPAGDRVEEFRELPTRLSDLLQRYPLLRRHPHPMLVHYPIVFMFAAPLFTLLTLLTGHRSFETTAFHCLGAGLLFLPLTIATGLLTWWINYEARFIRPVIVKIWCSGALLILTTLLFIWRVVTPDIALASGPLRIVYLLLLLALIPLVSVIGWFGANLTFPLREKRHR
jgi:predicted heme/steroid binding protein/uncharacterized membrane protein